MWVAAVDLEDKKFADVELIGRGFTPEEALENARKRFPDRDLSTLRAVHDDETANMNYLIRVSL
jgi:SHS2 domain-containing protein